MEATEVTLHIKNKAVIPQIFIIVIVGSPGFIVAFPSKDLT
jgi:hypothetical protein